MTARWYPADEEPGGLSARWLWIIAAALILAAILDGTLWSEPQVTIDADRAAPVSVQAGTSVPTLPQGSSVTTAVAGALPQAVIVPDVPAAPVADRLAPPITTPGTTIPPTPTPGDCSAWGQVFAWYGATPDEVAFFVPRIIDRETDCGRDMLNDRTGDSGICQINNVHNRSGWFGGRWFDDGGWLLALHGLRTRHDLESTRWADACLTLYRVCGAGAWRPPYSCANRPLP